MYKKEVQRTLSPTKLFLAPRDQQQRVLEAGLFYFLAVYVRAAVFLNTFRFRPLFAVKINLAKEKDEAKREKRGDEFAKRKWVGTFAFFCLSSCCQLAVNILSLSLSLFLSFLFFFFFSPLFRLRLSLSPFRCPLSKAQQGQNPVRMNEKMLTCVDFPYIKKKKKQ